MKGMYFSMKKIILLLIAVLILYFIGSKISLAKYVYNAVHDFYLGSKGFFFNSDKLSVNKSEFEIEKSNERKVEVSKSTGVKCPRCWTYANEFSDEGICMKCYKNM